MINIIIKMSKIHKKEIKILIINRYKNKIELYEKKKELLKLENIL